VAASALMLALWAIQLRTGNAAIVDAGWAFNLPLAAWLYAWLGHGDPVRTALLVGMYTLWGGRLGGYLLATRVVGRVEEGRYVDLRRRWRTHVAAKFLAFFQAQALLDVLLSLPALVVALNPRPGLGLPELLGLGLWATGLLGEVVADAQLSGFRRNPANHRRTCAEGLWRYSRHPNYFFEWVVWVGYAAFALGSPGGAAALSCPALVLYFLFRVTGIPATEAQALRSRGDAYRRYQQTTSAFVPWFPRTAGPR
jgi:steroid 5-alpha reductase family enzyme